MKKALGKRANFFSYPDDMSNAPYGHQCVWYVANRTKEIGWLVIGTGNGGVWGHDTSGLTDEKGKSKAHSAVNIQWGQDPYRGKCTEGHVMFVEYVNPDGSLIISECNVVAGQNGFDRATATQKEETYGTISAEEAKTLLGVFFLLNLGTKNIDIKEEKIVQTNERDKKEISCLKQELAEAELALKNAQTGQDKQKISGLQNAAQTLFKVYYNYDQRHKKNKERQQEVGAVVTLKVADQLFPLEADQLKSDYGTIQSHSNDLKVYVQPQIGDKLIALVDCDYTASAGQLSSKFRHYLFQVSYDIKTEKFTTVLELGNVGK